MLERHYRRPEVEEITGLSRSGIYQMMAEGRFPRPIKLAARVVVWPESAIREWITSRAAA